MSSKEKDTGGIGVEELLRLKRLERPDKSFWDGFQEDFDRRRLASILERPRGRERLRPILFRLSLVAAPLAVFAFAFQFLSLPTERPSSLPMASSGPAVGDGALVVNAESVFSEAREMPNSSLVVPEAGMNRRQFVTDSFSSSEVARAQRFRTVMVSPQLESPARNDLQYIRDSFRQGGYEVSSASFRMGTNF